MADPFGFLSSVQNKYTLAFTAKGAASCELAWVKSSKIQQTKSRYNNLGTVWIGVILWAWLAAR